MPTPTLPTSPDLERAFLAADPTWDGRFVGAVRTTGIFCRPSCRARKPLPRNVIYFADGEAARAAGYRACLRCQPESGRRVVARELGTPLGPVLAAASDAGVCLLEFTDRRMLPAQVAAVRRRIGSIRHGDHPHLDRLAAELDAYFSGALRRFSVPIDAPGSAFQERVWAALRGIPYGETVSYAELARRVGERRASRAVGRANGSNRVAIVVPCHRVINADGRLGGYGGGLGRKKRLLELEGGGASGHAHRRRRGLASLGGSVPA
ncbi:MAG TPA: methylated-DNA--[protein]-cysteine S-methyltransferase [Candidatus Limnocylindria bacterium]|nr:methylated-DNA--[protein]-cysteine S-methyltransferase [Candidatus Limnocylindria bacterium]